MGLFGGSSKVSSTLDQIDARVVGADGAYTTSTPINARASRGGSVTVSMLDAGAIGQGLQAAMAGIDAASGLAKQTQAAQGDLLSGALNMAADQNAKFASAIENVKTADVRTLIFAGLAVVALVAFKAFGRG